MKETVIAYQRCFDSEDGRLVLNDLMKSCHMMGTTLGNTPQETAFNEGARSVVVRILKTFHTDISQLEKLIENMEKQEGEQDEW